MTKTSTFRVFDMDGGIIYSGRGKAGAARKAQDALSGYRDAVAAGSGRLYGEPWTLGRIEINGREVDIYDVAAIVDAAEQAAREARRPAHIL